MKHRASVLIVGIATVVVAAAANAQSITPLSGAYRTLDKRFTMQLEFDGKQIKTTEPNGHVSTYTPWNQPNTWVYKSTLSRTNGELFVITITDDKHLVTSMPGKPERPGTKFELIKMSDMPDRGTHTEGMAAFDFYKTKIKTDPNNTHLWAACGAAAMAKAFYTEAGYLAYTKEVVASIKPIMVDMNSNPCPSVFPKEVWNDPTTNPTTN